MAGSYTPLYPNPLEADSVKSTEEFGLKVLKGCYNRWRNGFGAESWMKRVDRFAKNRLYASGRQNTSQYRDIVNADAQIQVLNIDYSPLPIAVPFLNRIKDRYMQRDEKVRCVAVDPFTQNKKREAKERERFKMNYAQQIQELQGNAGVELEQFRDDDPKNEQELDIKFGFTYKEKEEIIMELGIDMVLNDNKWWEVNKDRILWDMMCCGYSVVCTELDGNGRIKLPFVAPEYFITSYSEFQDFNDWQYQGQFRYMNISEIRMRFPKKFTEQELFDLAKSNSLQYGNPEFSYQWNQDRARALSQPWDSYVCPVVDIHYKTLYNLRYEKKVNSFGREILKKPKSLDPSKEYEVSAPYYVAYHGMWIVGTDHVLKWELARNMLKPTGNIQEVYSPYTIFMPNNNKCTNVPLIETMIPSIDLMHNLHYKTLQIIAAMAPDGADIDVTGLSDIDMGAGIGVVSPMQLWDMYLQTGNRYFKGTDDEGKSMGDKPPITPQTFAGSNKLEQLDNKWQREYEKLNILTGSSNLDAGIITNQGVASKTIDNAKAISTSASNYIYNAYVSILNGVARNISLRLWDKFVYGEGSFDGYTMALGRDNIEYLKVEATDDFEKTNFDVKIQAVIDDAYTQVLNQRIDLALAQGSITVQDSIELDMIDNPRYKAVMLANRTKQKMEADMEQARRNAQYNTEQATAAANAKGEQDLRFLQLQHQNNIEMQEAKNQSMELQEQFKFNGILKAKIVDVVFSKPGATIEDVPSFVWDGLNITNDLQKQQMLAAMQQMAMEQQEEQQEEQAQMQQQQLIQQQDPQMDIQQVA